MDNKASRSNVARNDVRLSRRMFVHGAAAAMALSTAKQVVSQDPPIPVPVPIAQGTNYFECVETHFDRLIHYSLDRFGPTRSAIWMSSLDINTNELFQFPRVQPEKDIRFIPGAYWYADQPMLVASYAVGTRSACKCYSDSVDEYLRSYFHLVKEEASLKSLRQSYWDAVQDKQGRIELPGGVLPTYTPAWEAMWRVDRNRTNRIINREVDRLLRTSAASIPDLNIAFESLLWLAKQNDELKAAAHDQIVLLANVCASIHQPQGGLIPHHHVAETLRFSANCLAASKALNEDSLRNIGIEVGVKRKDVLQRMANRASDPADAIRDSDLRIAQYCVVIANSTQEARYGDVVHQVADQVEQVVKHIGHSIDTAGGYGRTIRFLKLASEFFQHSEYLDLAKQVADEAVDKLFVEECGMFRSRVGVDRCDSLDGIGYLMLALLAIDDDDPTAGSALSF